MLTFHLFRIPVTVRPSFLIVAALLGFSYGEVSLVIAWVAIVAFSILIHELGHAFTARSFGSTVEIELNTLGGLTSWSIPDQEFGPGRRAAVAAAGSAVGVVFGALVWVVAYFTGPFDDLAYFVVRSLIWVNLFWGLLNWLPIRPLDGGHLFVSLLEKVAPRHAVRISNVVFMLTALGALVAALYLRLTFVALLSGFLLFGELTRGRVRPPPVPIPPMSFDRQDQVAEPETSTVQEPEAEPKEADS